MDITRLKAASALMAVVLTAVWWLSLAPGALTSGFWPARGALIDGTGILALGLMAIAVILAARPVQIEGFLGGLDKFYRLHKWLGLAAALLAVAHWLLENGPRWMVGQGWLTRPQRPPAPAELPAGFDPFRDLRGLATEIGEWGFYLLLILVALALWKRVPYRYFFRAHRLLALVFLMLVFHGAILMGPDYWTGPTGPVMAFLMAGGAVAATTSLFHRIGKSRKAVGTIESLTRYHDNAVLDVGIRLTTAWPGHHAGQFAFVDFGGVEGAHPFTISSAWHRDGRLMFSIKGLGDYTRALPQQLFAGQAVTVEGPYGRFDFRRGNRRQIWIGGGIGITPFIAGLEAIADGPREGAVDLIYSTNVPAEAFIERIRRLADQASVRFHLWQTPQDGLLTLDHIERIIPDWKDADVWFCGPLRFGHSLRDAMTARGFAADRFRHELFDMR